MAKRPGEPAGEDWAPGWSKRDAANGRLPAAPRGGTPAVIRDVLGPDGKVRRRISEDVVRRALEESGRKR